MEIVRTPRLRLRVAKPEDAAFFYTLVNDPDFIEHIGDKGIRSVEEARAALLTGPIAMQEARGHSLYMVELKEEGTLIGMCGLIKRDTLDGIDLGYAYLPDWRGQGYAFEAGRAVLDHAPTLGIERLLAIVSPANAASNGLLRKLGMRFERFMHMPPDDKATNLYSMELTRAG
jgi:RimJ/RimL family protein N-acetyltransferase